jgi:phytoene desaturase (3,4-didehydrolycopene-forming)
MLQLFRQVFETLGTSIEGEGIEMLKCEPNYCIWLPTETSLSYLETCPTFKAQISAMRDRVASHDSVRSKLRPD